MGHINKAELQTVRAAAVLLTRIDKAMKKSGACWNCMQVRGMGCDCRGSESACAAAESHRTREELMGILLRHDKRYDNPKGAD